MNAERLPGHRVEKVLSSTVFADGHVSVVSYRPSSASANVGHHEEYEGGPEGAARFLATELGVEL